MHSVIELEYPRHYKLYTALAISAAIVSLAGLATYAQTKAGATGKATVVERRGPEVAVAANGGGQVVVLFPQATAPQGGTSDVEVVLVESQTPAAVEGQPAPTASPTGREILFSTRDASDGLVRYTLDQSGNARKLMVLARVGGKYVEAKQTGGGEGVTVLTVQQPAPETPATPEGQPPAATPAAPAAPPAQAAVIMIYNGGTAAR